MIGKLALICVLVSGCSTTDSADLTTHGIYADLGARSTGQGSTTVYATLYRDSPATLDYVTLSGNDALVATNNGQDKTMSEAEFLNVVSHTATFATDTPGEVFDIAFLRTVDSGAPLSTAVLPDAFTLGPVGGPKSRAADLAVSWAPSGSGDHMSWQAYGDCIEIAGGTFVGDTGSERIAAGTLKKRQGDGIADSCQVTLTVSRTRDGDLDPGFGKGGSIVGAQDRSAQVSSTL